MVAIERSGRAVVAVRSLGGGGLYVRAAIAVVKGCRSTVMPEVSIKG